MDTKNVTHIFNSVRNVFVTAYLRKMGFGVLGPTAGALQTSRPKEKISTRSSQQSQPLMSSFDAASSASYSSSYSASAHDKFELVSTKDGDTQAAVRKFQARASGEIRMTSNKQLDFTQLDLLDSIGKGPFGEVHKAKFQGSLVAGIFAFSSPAH